MKNTFKILTVLAAASLAVTSCFNLEEKAFDRLDKASFYNGEVGFQSALASIYYEAQCPVEHFIWLNECSGDQLAWRVWNEGSWGYDEGEKYVLSTHTWTPESVIIRKAWTGTWSTIGLCNQLLYDVRGKSSADFGISEEKLAAYIAEARTIRAWSYLKIFDIWGGVLPLNTKSAEETVDLPESESKVQGSFEAGCKSIYNFISTELDESLEALPVNDVNHMNQAANRVLKARLLINAKVYIGEDHYKDCADICEAILRGDYGKYSLAEDFREIYSEGNEKCKEIIFAYAWDLANSPALAYNMRNFPSIAYNTFDILGFSGSHPDAGPWNCVILAPSFDNSGKVLKTGGTDGGKSFVTDYGDKLGAVYERMNRKDIRRGPFVCKEDKSWSGLFLMGPQYLYGTNKPAVADADRPGEDLVYVDQVGSFLGKGHDLEVVMSPRWGETNSGYRLIRYPIYPDACGVHFIDIDDVQMRLAEVVYMLAECNLNGIATSQDAKTLVNSVRKRYYNAADWAEVKDTPGPGFTAFDKDWMLSEWGLEFLGEGERRRTDLRRFDKFTQGQWWFFGRCYEGYPAKRDRKYEWYPLPTTALTVNPGLEQNPNY